MEILLEGIFIKQDVFSSSMFTYIHSKTFADSIEEWQELIKDYSSQIIQYPDSIRPYCDVSELVIQMGSFYDFTSGQNTHIIGFDNYMVHIDSDDEFHHKKVTVLRKEDGWEEKIVIEGNLEVGTTYQTITRREVSSREVGTHSFLRSGPEYDGQTINIDNNQQTPSIKSLSEIYGGFF